MAQNIFSYGGGASMQDYVAAISSVGFPIFIAMFVMIRIDSKIEKLIAGFAQLSEAIHQDIEVNKNENNEELLKLLQELNKKLNDEANNTNGELLELLEEINKNLTEVKKSRAKS